MPETTTPRGGPATGHPVGDDRHKDNADRRQRFELDHAEIEDRIHEFDETLLPGWPLLPVRGKKDTGKGVRERAAIDERRALFLAADHDGWAVRLDDQVVIDLDRGHAAGVDGITVFCDLMDALLPAGVGNPTTVGSTPAGGRHFHYQVPTGVNIRGGAGCLGAGVDVLTGSNRTCVISGPGRILVGDLQLAPLPAPLVAILSAEPSRPRATARPTVDVDPGRRLAGAARRVAEAGQGERNAVLNWCAFTAGRAALAAGIPISIVTEVLISAAADAGLDAREAQATIRSGLRTVA